MTFNRQMVYLVVLLGYLSYYFLRKFKKKSRQVKTYNEILQIEDGKEFITELKEYIYNKAEKSGTTALSTLEKNVYFPELFETNIHGYGFYSYLQLQEPIDITGLTNALTAINARYVLSLLKKAATLFKNNSIPSDPDERLRQMNEWSSYQKSRCEDLDKRFFRCHDTVSIALEKYILENVAAFTQQAE